jgi:hypothetical protein
MLATARRRSSSGNLLFEGLDSWWDASAPRVHLGAACAGEAVLAQLSAASGPQRVWLGAPEQPEPLAAEIQRVESGESSMLLELAVQRSTSRLNPRPGDWLNVSWRQGTAWSVGGGFVLPSAPGALTLRVPDFALSYATTPGLDANGEAMERMFEGFIAGRGLARESRCEIHSPVRLRGALLAAAHSPAPLLLLDASTGVATPCRLLLGPEAADEHAEVESLRLMPVGTPEGDALVPGGGVTLFALVQGATLAFVSRLVSTGRREWRIESPDTAMLLERRGLRRALMGLSLRFGLRTPEGEDLPTPRLLDLSPGGLGLRLPTSCADLLDDGLTFDFLAAGRRCTGTLAVRHREAFDEGHLRLGCAFVDTPRASARGFRALAADAMTYVM